MTSIRSNNPFRNSFHPDDASSSPLTVPPPSHPLQKTPSTTTTIVEEEEPESPRTGRHLAHTTNITDVTTRGPEIPQTAITIDPSKKTPAANGTNGQIVITIQATDSCSSSPPHTGIQPGHRLSIDCSNRDQDYQMWPARRMLQKARIRGKRRWIILKVVIAVVIIVGAVAVGLGISKAVGDTRAKQNSP